MKFSILSVLLLLDPRVVGCVGAAEGEIDDDGAPTAEASQGTRSSAQAVASGPVRVAYGNSLGA